MVLLRYAVCCLLRGANKQPLMDAAFPFLVFYTFEDFPTKNYHTGRKMSQVASLKCSIKNSMLEITSCGGWTYRLTSVLWHRAALLIPCFPDADEAGGIIQQNQAADPQQAQGCSSKDPHSPGNRERCRKWRHSGGGLAVSLGISQPSASAELQVLLRTWTPLNEGGVRLEMGKKC